MITSDPGFPNQHTTTTVTSTTVQPTIRFDKTYINIRNIPGILKVVQLIINIIGLICIGTSAYKYDSSGNWFSTVAGTGFVVTLVLLILYIFHVIEKLYFIPWLLAELGYTGLWAIFYFTAATVCAASAGYDAGFGASAFFGYAGMIAYGVDAFLKFKAWRGGQIAQGERTVNKTSGTPGAQSPAY